MRILRQGVVAGVIAVGLVATGMAGPTGPAAAAPRRPAEAAAPTLVPVVVIVMENEPLRSIVGNKAAPFINGTLIRHGLLDTDYRAVPGSLADYLLMVSGRTRARPAAANLFTALGRRHSWREFMESMPSTCYLGRASGVVHGTRAALYAHTHNPAVYFSGVTKTGLCRDVVPLDRSEFSASRLLAFSLVVPNECNDMHTMPTNHQCPMWDRRTNRASTEIGLGDNWLAAFVPALARVATVVVTWDEGRASDERIATIEYGVGVRPGRDRAALGQPSLEAGLYRYFRLGRPPGAGGRARALTIP